jgi:hypothetical protein
MFVGKAIGVNSRVENRIGASLGGKLLSCSQTLDLLERLARVKHAGLLQAFVNYGRKKFYNIGPRSLSKSVFPLTILYSLV